MITLIFALVIGFGVLLIAFIIIDGIMYPKRMFNSIEVGDKICTKYEYDDYDMPIPLETIKVVSVKRDENDKVESITFDNDTTITSYKEFKENDWFIC